MTNHQSKKIIVNIHGMHCASCEVLIERKFKHVAGVENVNVNYASGKAELLCSQEPNLRELNNCVKEDGYHVSVWQNGRQTARPDNYKNTQKDYLQMGGILLVIVSVYVMLQQVNLVPSIAISAHMSYGVVFLVGLFAAMSTCIAVVGGLLLAVTGTYNESRPYLTGIQKFRPHIYFNAGRIVGYTAFGAVVGGLGSVVVLSARSNGYLIIVVSFVMLLLGFQLLHLFPWLKRFSPKMPKFISHEIHDASAKENKSTPFMLGASTFFLPCGFTQALQLYVLATGNWKVGALTMLVFSFGTLPALISLSALSSFVKGAFQNYFLKFAGVAVVLLSVFNINNGLTLAGYNFNLASAFRSSNAIDETNAPVARIVDGKQIVDMEVVGLSYSPNRFTVVRGVPVEWRIDGSRAKDCAQVITVPQLNITKYLSSQGITLISFMPQELGNITFSCTMGMTTRGSAFTVVPNTTGIVGAKVEQQSVTDGLVCDPTVTTCIEAQKVSIEVSRERGIYPQSLTVKKGIPIELTIDNRARLGGCMSVWVIPAYNITIPMKFGIIKTIFTPTETGTVAMTCSMGNKMAEFEVIS